MDTPEYICGICGGTDEDKDGCCIKGHDSWVYLEDLHNPELTVWVDSQVLSRDELAYILTN